MKRFMVLGLGFLGAMGWAVPAMAQTTTTQKFQQGTNSYSGCMDTYIDRDPAWVDDWFGNETRIEIRSWAGTPGEKMNILIKFDVSTLPANATITAAKLTFYNIRARGDNGDVPVLEKVTAAWNGQTTWNMWNTGVPNTVASGVTCPPVPNTYIDDPSTPPPASEAYVITGLETLVQEWKTTPLLNYGVMLSATTDLNFRFASSEYATVSVRPELEVTYTTPAPANPPTVTATAPTPPYNSPITVTGTASATAPATVTQVTWANSLSGATGSASGTTAWTATIPLVNGNNAITITVTDSTGATGTTSFTIGYFPPKVAGKKDNTYCGIGVAGGSPGAFAVAALALALLLMARSRRPA